MHNSNQIAEGLKNIMKGLPVPLAIITAKKGSVKRGITVSSFTTLSMHPPLITFNIECGSQFCQFFEAIENFAVHFPSREQIELCMRFATSGLTSREQFLNIKNYENEYGVPVLKEISSKIYCNVKERIRVADHYILVGKVLETCHTKENKECILPNPGSLIV